MISWTCPKLCVPAFLNISSNYLDGEQLALARNVSNHVGGIYLQAEGCRGVDALARLVGHANRTGRGVRRNTLL